MLQVSRDNNLKIPKQIIMYEKSCNSRQDSIAIKTAVELGNDKKIKEKNIIYEDKDLDFVSKIPFNSNDLIVITVVKKLGAYIITVAEKSPKKFRGVFVNRMQNYCLDTLECLLEANFIRLDSKENKLKREELQKEAIIKLKLLAYISLVAQNSGCILKKQYKQISKQLSEAVNLIIAWKKSDDTRLKKLGL